MQIVIDIPEERYKDIQRIASVQLEDRYFQTGEQIIARGTPLPKGHGRLIDADALYNEYVKEPEEFNGGHSLMALFRIAPTIIEADKAESEVKE